LLSGLCWSTEKMVGYWIKNAAQAKSVAALPLLKQCHDPLRALTFGFIEINPGK
jgi:hypothetical protein